MNEPDDTPAAESVTREQPLSQLQRMLTRSASAKTLFAPGDRVPNAELWVLGQLLGQGGFGEVWLAQKQGRDEWRAVKFCTHPVARNRLATHETNVVFYVLKYMAQQGRGCENIVSLLDCNLTAEIPWLMYEYVPGKRTLATLIEESIALPAGQRMWQSVDTLHAVSQAMGQLHHLTVPIVHRDLKPHNILMDGATPRVTDFGIGGAAVVAAISDTTGGRSELLVQLPTMLQRTGTLLYASPEQLFGSPPSPRDDVYALGVIAYQMLVGSLKYAPGTDAAEELRELSVPDELISLIVKSVSLNPDRRPKDGVEWDRALMACKRKAIESISPAEPLKVHPIRIEMWGDLYSRPARNLDREWVRVAMTPAEVTITPGQLYRFVVDAPVTDQRLEGIDSLAKLGLHSASFRDCKQLTDVGVQRLTLLTTLRSLTLRGCDRLTDTGLNCFLRLTALRMLRVVDGYQLTPAGIAALQDALPKCKIQLR